MIDYKKIVEFFLEENLKEHKYIIEVEDNSSFSTIIVKVEKEHMGKIIGKDGNIISSIRNLINSVSKKENKKVKILIKEM